MNIVLFLVIGLVAGWLAGQIMKGKGFGLVGNLVVGVIGAFLGGFPLRACGNNHWRIHRVLDCSTCGSDCAALDCGSCQEKMKILSVSCLLQTKPLILEDGKGGRIWGL